MVDYAAFLLSEYADGKVLKGVISNDYEEVKPKKVYFNLDRVNKLLGTDVKEEEAVDILKKLQFEVHKNNGEYEVTVPTHRVDIDRWVDIAEEIARIHGYDKIQTTVPEIFADGKKVSSFLQIQREVREKLVALGFYEAVNFSFMNDKFLAKFYDERRFIYLKNPLSEDMNAMRTYVFPGLINTIVSNVRQGNESVRFFEFANVFIRKDDKKLPEQYMNMALAITEDFWPLSWSVKNDVEPYYYLKGVTENLLNSYKLNVRFVRAERNFLHPGKSADIVLNDEVIGFIGELHPDIMEYIDFDKRILIVEIFFEKVVKLIDDIEVKYEKFSLYPKVSKDISVVVDEDIYAEEMINAIYDIDKLVSEVYLYDIFRDKKIGEGKKSLTFRIYFSSLDRTLTDEETNELLGRIISELEIKFQAKLR